MSCIFTVTFAAYTKISIGPIVALHFIFVFIELPKELKTAYVCHFLLILVEEEMSLKVSISINELNRSPCEKN